MAPPAPRLIVALVVLAACAKSGDGDSSGDAGAGDAGACRENECEYQGACELPTACHPVFPGQICADGEWLDTCGNGRCDCGEGGAACREDCECDVSTCADGAACVAPGTCRADGAAEICSLAGTFVASCGDDVCNCGETLATCAGDCPPDEPFWSDCVARFEDCDAYCETLELRCSDACTTSRGRRNWGAESWPEGEECGGEGSAEALCGDPWGDRIGAEPHWRCCCAP
jgi:hypothetical protein